METKSTQVAIGFELTPVSHFVTIETSQAYSGWPEQKNWHTDEDVAKKYNFPGIVVQGNLGSAYISQMCTKFFGARWFTHGRLSLSFKKPVFPPQCLTARGAVRERVKEEGGTRVTIDVWLENEAAEKVTDGTASCVYSSTNQ